MALGIPRCVEYNNNNNYYCYEFNGRVVDLARRSVPQKFQVGQKTTEKKRPRIKIVSSRIARYDNHKNISLTCSKRKKTKTSDEQHLR